MTWGQVGSYQVRWGEIGPVRVRSDHVSLGRVRSSSSGATDKWSTVGSCAFTVAGPKTRNALPEDVTSSQSEYTFHRQLKTWLFKKTFKDIISLDTDCISTFSLCLSVATLRRFCRLRTMIWYDDMITCAISDNILPGQHQQDRKCTDYLC